MVDPTSRDPVVEEVHNASFKETRIKLKEIFATYGTQRKILAGNGHHSNQRISKKFAEEEWFQHHRITLLHSQANREVEQIASLQNKDKIERQARLLMAHRATPHPATGVEPYTAIEGWEIRITLDYNKPNGTEKEKKGMNKIIESNDEKYKNKFNANWGKIHTWRLYTRKTTK